MTQEPPSTTIEGSALLQKLLQKLTAFQQLIDQQRFDKAALIAADIEDELANFQPLRYFPKTFSAYTRLMSLHIDQIAQHWQHKDSLSWHAMHKHYQTDMDSFLDS